MRSSDSIVTIDNGNWGATSLSAVRAVLESTASLLCDAFGRAPDAPVQVSPWDQAPRVAWDLRPYRIWISARDTYWCQYAYQFSHELCHILVNFDQVRRHRHKWFEESICELSALFALHRLSEGIPTSVALSTRTMPLNSLLLNELQVIPRCPRLESSGTS